MNIKAIFGIVVVLSMIGCGVGDAPKPMSQQDVKAALDRATPEDQIKFIQSAPITAADKKKKIDEVKTKYNLSDADVERMTSGQPKNTGTGN